MYKPRHAWMFLMIPGIFLIIFTLLPTIGAVGLSFTDYNVFTPSKWVGGQNYAKILHDAKFWSAIKNTIYYWILVTPALTIFSILLAVLVNRDVKGVSVYRLIYYFPVLISVVVTAMLWKWMFQEDGIINYLLHLFGVAPKAWLTSRNLVIPSLAIVTIWQGLGYYMLFYLAGLQSIPNDLYEAADIEGAGFWKKQWYVTIPLLRPVIFFVAVVSTMSAFKEFTLMLTMTNGGPIGASTTVVFLVFEKAFEQLQMGYASAISCILFLIILLITLLNQKVLDKDNQV
ncbi:carbohydrate ABC transporter permease [Xylanivirga thermophila]|uniref:carbohydrate ABC transporter permease n=1 Tax=Xylanivirga thermophila TaxID=2496273 RepID=UPI00101D1E67|nr:sugar ABC transporter permease [Xylanivirga thermophila]